MQSPSTRIPSSVAQVRRRDGARVPYDRARIVAALARAGAAAEAFGAGRAAELAARVEERLAGRERVDVEAIQDEAEEVLLADGETAAARAYIRYREQHRLLREDRRSV